MLKKLLKKLGKLAPSFLHKLDDYLIARHPLIWSLRLHYVIYYNALVVVIFTTFIYLVPISPASAFNLQYFSFLSLILSVFSLGLWLFAQNQYNVQRGHGLCSPFFSLRYCLLSFLIMCIFVVAACIPVWMAADRAYTKIVGEEIIDIAHRQNSDNYYDRRAQRMDFFKYLPKWERDIEQTIVNAREHYEDRKRDVQMLRQALEEKQYQRNEKEHANLLKELGREQALLEDSKALKNSQNAFIKVLFDNFLLEGKSNLRRRDLSNPTGVEFDYKGQHYTQYELQQDSYNYSSRLFYLDEKGNPYYLNDLIKLFLVDRLINMSSEAGNISFLDLVNESYVFSDAELRTFIDLYTSIENPPALYSLVAEFEQDELTFMILATIILPCILTLMLAATTANLYGTRAFFIDTAASVAIVFFILTMMLVIDNSTRGTGADTFLLSVSALVFTIATVINILLVKFNKRHKAATLLWQVSTFLIPVSLFVSVIGFMNEVIDARLSNEALFGTVLGFCAATLFLLFPLQMRLAHKLYALPR